MNNPSQPGQAMPTIRFRTPRNLYWVRDAHFTLLVDEQRCLTRQLEGDAAELWGWLSIGHSPALCAHLLSVMNDITLLDAAFEIDQHLCEWREAAFLINSGDSQ